MSLDFISVTDIFYACLLRLELFLNLFLVEKLRLKFLHSLFDELTHHYWLVNLFIHVFFLQNLSWYRLLSGAHVEEISPFVLGKDLQDRRGKIFIFSISIQKHNSGDLIPEARRKARRRYYVYNEECLC